MEKRKKKEYSDRWNHLLDFAEKGDLRRLQIIFEDPDNQTLLDNLLGTGVFFLLIFFTFFLFFFLNLILGPFFWVVSESGWSLF